MGKLKKTKYSTTRNYNVYNTNPADGGWSDSNQIYGYGAPHPDRRMNCCWCPLGTGTHQSCLPGCCTVEPGPW